MTMRAIIPVAMLFTLAASPVAAAQCAPRQDVAAQLSAKYGEVPRAMGLAANGTAVVDVFASDGGSWTITVTTADGRTCLIAAGTAFVAIEYPAGVPG